MLLPAFTWKPCWKHKIPESPGNRRIRLFIVNCVHQRLTLLPLNMQLGIAVQQIPLGRAVTVPLQEHMSRLPVRARQVLFKERREHREEFKKGRDELGVAGAAAAAAGGRRQR
jgi:hypothetical protein